MIISRALFTVLTAALVAGAAAPALAQSCTRQGVDVSCDDGRRGVFAGEAIIWADGTRSSLVSPHPSVIIGNNRPSSSGPACSSARATAWCRWKTRAIRAGRAARCWMACRIVTELSGARFLY